MLLIKCHWRKLNIKQSAESTASSDSHLVAIFDRCYCLPVCWQLGDNLVKQNRTVAHRQCWTFSGYATLLVPRLPTQQQRWWRRWWPRKDNREALGEKERAWIIDNRRVVANWEYCRLLYRLHCPALVATCAPGHWRQQQFDYLREKHFAWTLNASWLQFIIETT